MAKKRTGINLQQSSAPLPGNEDASVPPHIFIPLGMRNNWSDPGHPQSSKSVRTIGWNAKIGKFHEQESRSRETHAFIQNRRHRLVECQLYAAEEYQIRQRFFLGAN